MSLLERIAACNRHDLSRYAPFVVAGAAVGHVRRDRLPALAGAAELAECSAERVVLRGASFDACTAGLAGLVDRLAAAGALRAPLGEAYPVGRRFTEPPLAALDRVAVSWFGIPAYGVHVNGFVRGASGLEMWIARRSRHKPTFPGMLDNMVAGGQPFGLSPDENVRKECAEEAGIPAALAARAIPVGAVSYCAEHESGLKPDTMFCYDLELPADFRPVCVDGEVEAFERWPIERVAETVRETTEFKFNCNLVIIDFLVRHGCLGPGEPDYCEIVRGLRRGSG